MPAITEMSLMYIEKRVRLKMGPRSTPLEMVSVSDLSITLCHHRKEESESSQLLWKCHGCI